MSRIRTVFLLLLAAALPAALSAQQSEPVGTILQTSGNVQSVSSGGASHTLRRRSEIHAGDRIIVGPRGFVQMRMVDSAIISLSENTDFTIHEYLFDDTPGRANKAILELHKGGLRTIDGLIGKEENDQYLLITPGGDVTPHGTAYSCSVAEDDTTYCGVNQGGIKMSNEAGSVDLGIGANADYAKAENRQTAPEILLQMPPQLGGIPLIPPGNQPAPPQQPNSAPGQGPAITVIPRRTTRISPGPNTITPQQPGGTFPAPIPIKVEPYKNTADDGGND